MTFYLVYDGEEFGPYSWADIFAGLHRGDWTSSDLIRPEDSAEAQPISEVGFWEEGVEVGPLTWEDILRLMDEGCLDERVLGKTRGSSEYSTLGLLIADRPYLRESVVAIRPNTRRSRYALAVSIGAILMLFFGGLGFYFGAQRSHSSQEQIATPIAISDAKSKEAAPAPVEEQPTSAPSPFFSEVAVVPTRVKSSHETPVEAPPLPSTSALVTASRPAPNEPSAPNKASLSVEAHMVEAAPSPVKAQVAETTPAGVDVAADPKTTPVSRATASPATQVMHTAASFFNIRMVKFVKKEPKDGFGVWRFAEIETKNKSKKVVPDEFQPCLEVVVSAAENTRSDATIAKAYFFDADNKLAFSHKTPSNAGKQTDRTHFAMPVLFKKNEPDRFFFEIPENLRSQNWKAVVVFGDKYEAKSFTYPQTASDFMLSYPEKELVYDRTAKRVSRKPAMDALVEHVVKTKNPRQPQLTLFLRPPKGVSSASEVKGVLALCVLAPSVESIKRELQKEEMGGDYNGLLGFANKNKLAIVAWGSRGFWDVGKNFDELAKDRAKEIDKNFDFVADAWERGVKELCDKYGLPNRNFLIWGQSGSAQWAKRLCLRKPDYFLAIHIHVPSSFDKPTPEARKVLWCVTTGELEAGYERSKRFVSECQRLGYPIVYKAIPGLGHAGHPDAAELGFKFFEFALSQIEAREAFDRREKDRLSIPSIGSSDKTPPWPEVFQKPAYYGDAVNQEMFPAEEKDLIPEGYRIPIPNKDIATIWAKSK